jgi:hypothetical protein
MCFFKLKKNPQRVLPNNGWNGNYPNTLREFHLEVFFKVKEEPIGVLPIIYLFNCPTGVSLRYDLIKVLKKP